MATTRIIDISDEEMLPREVRLGVTMSGGSSLAIYENGVSQELFRCIWGHGIYGVLKVLTHSDFIVDVLSGTSAGGVNSVFLSTALVHKTDFAATRSVWVNLGGIDELLQDPDADGAPALLKGNTYYLPQLEEAFTRLTRAPTAKTWQVWQEQGVAWVARPKPLHIELYVTGTYYRALERTYFDSLNRPIYTNEYRGVFRLAYDESASEVARHASPFLRTVDGLSDAPARRMARVARTTSSLPAIFEPSLIDASLLDQEVEFPPNRKSFYMMDGGYLNNVPLDLLVQAINRRPGSVEIVRKVFLVEPEPDAAQKYPPHEDEPTALDNILFYVGVQFDQSLNRTMDWIWQHNHQVRQISETLEAIRPSFKRVGEYSRKLLKDSGHDGELLNRAVDRDRPWYQLRIQSIRSLLRQSWEAQLGFSSANKGPVRYPYLTATSTSARVSDRRGRAGQRLMQLVLGIQHHLQASCIELNEQDPTRTYYLREIDTPGVKRRISRAIDELYGFLYPPGDPLADQRSHRGQQSLRQRRWHAPLARTLRNTIDKLYELLRLTEQLEKALLGKLSSIADDYCMSQADMTLDQAWIRIVCKVREWLYVAPAVPADRTWPAWPGDDIKEAASKALSAFFNRPDASTGPGPLLYDKIEPDLLRPAFCYGDHCSPENVSNTAGFENSVSLVSLIAAHLSTLLDTALTAILESTVGDEVLGDQEASQTALVPLLREYHHVLTYAGKRPQTKRRAPEDRKQPSPLPTVGPLREAGRVVEAYFDFLDRALFPVEYATESVGGEPIELIQINARDTQLGLSARSLKRKLAGRMLGHMGALLKRAWRSNDIMWGRLDASATLALSLLDEERILRVVGAYGSNSAARAQRANRMLHVVDAYLATGLVSAGCAHDCTGSPCTPHNEFKRADPVGQALRDDWIGGGKDSTSLRTRYWQWLTTTSLDDQAPLALLVQTDWARLESAEASSSKADPQTKDDLGLLNLLLKRHQLDVTRSELPEVLADAIMEHVRWSNENDATAWWPAVGGQLEGKAEREAQQLASKFPGATPEMDELTHQSARKWVVETVANHADQYLKKNYAIGDETITTGIPYRISAQRVVNLLLIVLNVLTTSLWPRLKDHPEAMESVNRTLSPVRLVLKAMRVLLGAVNQGTRTRAAIHGALWGGTALAAAYALWASSAPGAGVALVLLALEAGLAGLDAVPGPYARPSLPYLISLGLTSLLLGYGGSSALRPLAHSLYTSLSNDVFSKWIAISIPTAPLVLRVHLMVMAMATVGFLTFLVAGAEEMAITRNLRTAFSPAGIVSLELAFRPARSLRILQGWDSLQRGQLQNASNSINWDNVFVVGYVLMGLIVAGATDWLAGNQVHPVLSRVWFWIILAGVFDWAENFGLRQQLRTYLANRNATASDLKRWPGWASACSTMKFTLLAAATLVCILSLAHSARVGLGHLMPLF